MISKSTQATAQQNPLIQSQMEMAITSEEKPYVFCGSSDLRIRGFTVVHMI